MRVVLLAASPALALTVLSAAGCRHFPLGAPGPGEEEAPSRPTRPIPESLAARFTPQHPAWGLRLTLVDYSSSHERYGFKFDTYSEVYLEFRTISGDYYRSLRGAPGSRSPLILDSPILGGAKDNYLADRIFSRWATRWGFSSIFLHQDSDILTGQRDGLELERLLRESILAYRKALDLFIAERPEIDPERLGTFGISLGALKNVVLAAVEPRLKANVICLGGGDLPRILLESKERMVLRYLRRREAADGLSRAEVCAELERELVAEPLDLAEFIPPEKVFLFLGSLDNKVPYATGLSLRRALGRPSLTVFPLGHYTGILAAPFAAVRGFNWMERRFRE